MREQPVRWFEGQAHQLRQENPPGGQIGQGLVIGTDKITGAAGKLLFRDGGADDLIILDKLVSGSPQAAAKKDPDNLFRSDHRCLFAGGRHPINVNRFAFWGKSMYELQVIGRRCRKELPCPLGLK